MQKRTTKIGVFTKKELKTPEGKKLYKALYRINHPKTGSKPAQDPEKLRIIGEMDLFPKPTAESEARTLTAFEKQSEKARQIHDALVRLVEMLKSKDKAHLAESVDGFLLRLKDGDGGEPLVFDALLLGAELGADTDTGNLLRQILANQAKTEPYLAGVPAVVEQANENIREGMGELYRVLYAPGMTARQKVIADAMRQAKGVVREAARLLQLDSAWRSKGVSVSTISRELDKMDMLFADAKMTNPFASREHNRKRPVVDNPCRKRKVDSDDPDSAVEIVPTRPGGYGSDETDDETP